LGNEEILLGSLVSKELDELVVMTGNDMKSVRVRKQCSVPEHARDRPLRLVLPRLLDVVDTREDHLVELLWRDLQDRVHLDGLLKSRRIEGPRKEDRLTGDLSDFLFSMSVHVEDFI
jgi:hypothetical protein